MNINSVDRESARALVDAGYMPLRDYVEMFGDDCCSPGTVPLLADMEHRPGEKKSIFSYLLELLPHH